MKLYLSGPMTGIEEFNYPRFREVARELRALGHEVVSPAEQDDVSGLVPGSSTWSDFVRWDLRVLLDGEAVVVLDGWRHSRGARLEVHVATELGMNVLTLAEAVDGVAA